MDTYHGIMNCEDSDDNGNGARYEIHGKNENQNVNKNNNIDDSKHDNRNDNKSKKSILISTVGIRKRKTSNITFNNKKKTDNKKAEVAVADGKFFSETDKIGNSVLPMTDCHFSDIYKFNNGLNFTYKTTYT